MNRYIFTGNLGADATITKVSEDTEAVNFNVGITEKWTDSAGVKQEKTTWASCSWFRKTGDSVKVVEYLKKGTKVLCTGKPSARPWLDKDSYAHASLDVVLQDVELCGSTPQNNAAAATTATKAAGVKDPKAAPTTTATTNTATTSTTMPPPGTEATEDELPF